MSRRRRTTYDELKIDTRKSCFKSKDERDDDGDLHQRHEPCNRGKKDVIAVALRRRDHTDEGDETEQQAREFKNATNRRDIGLVDTTLGYRCGLTIVDRMRMMSGCRVVRCVHVRRRSIVVRRGRLELAKSQSSSLSLSLAPALNCIWHSSTCV